MTENRTGRVTLTGFLGVLLKGVCENCEKEMDIVLSHKRFCSEKCQTQFWHREIQKPKLEAEKQARRDKVCL